MTSLYDISIPVLTTVLKTTLVVLKKGEEYTKEKGLSTADLVNLRISEDMLPLRFQVFIIAAITTKAIGRMTSNSLPELENREYTLEELYAILDKTLEQLAGVSEESLAGREGVEVLCQTGKKTWKPSAVEYIHGYTIPNVFFHLTILYALLRKQGVPLGKADYLGVFMKNFPEA
ncbi:hypothetical protein BJ170DRAFT_87041 [Xylariales sp. AK1849]|nr:hypothetical protein BJ170DRAFT_87041 [Xylariales sp. AK1849]